MAKPLDFLFPLGRMRGSLLPQGVTPPVSVLVKATVAVAWPSIVEQFLISLVGFVDTLMVSGLGTAAIAAVGLTNQPKFITLVPFFSLNVALSSVVARRRGQKNRESANDVLRFSLILAFALTLVISFFAVFFADDILTLAGAGEDIKELSAGYFRIIEAGMFFNVISLVINAAQRGAGKTKIAMRTNLTSNAVNLVFNYLLIEGHFGFPRLELKGAAIATVLGTVVAMFMSIASLKDKDGFLSFSKIRLRQKVDKTSLDSLWKVGSASLVEQLFLRIGFMTYAIIVASLGTLAFATHQIGMQIIGLSFSLGNGLSIAAVALVGKSLGENREDLAKIYGSICQRIGLAFSLCLSFVFFLAGERIFSLFSSDPQVLQYANHIMSLIVIIVVLQISQVIFSGCLRGAGDTRSVALISLVSVAIIRPLSGWFFVYPMHLGLVGAWLGLGFDQFMRFSLTLIRFKSGKWLKIKL